MSNEHNWLRAGSQNIGSNCEDGVSNVIVSYIHSCDIVAPALAEWFINIEHHILLPLRINSLALYHSYNAVAQSAKYKPEGCQIETRWGE
jgi:hypothetical protein